MRRNEVSSRPRSRTPSIDAASDCRLCASYGQGRKITATIALATATGLLGEVVVATALPPWVDCLFAVVRIWSALVPSILLTPKNDSI